MKWYKHKPEVGDTKVKKKFALLPIELNGEVRWLEFVTIEYEYTRVMYEEGFYALYWKRSRFVE